VHDHVVLADRDVDDARAGENRDAGHDGSQPP
jgi:hypothetical protein